MTVLPYDTISTTSETDTIGKKCCFCIPMRIGCFILAYLNLVINFIRILLLLIITSYVGINTNWFDHISTENAELTTDGADEVESIDKPLLTRVEISLMVLLVANVVWLCVNVTCIVGLHKKRPAPIKVYIRFAVARLLLMFFGMVYLIMNNTDIQTIIFYILDLGMNAYSVLVYYNYSLQLHLEQGKGETEVQDQGFNYPTKLDIQHLVV